MVENYMTEEGYFLSGSSRYSHSLDSMLFQYQNTGGNRDNIKLEFNYSLRSHIFAPVERRMVTDIFEEKVIVRTLEPIEIFAAKANALMNRAAARDLYDFNNMIYFGLFDESEYELFRKCIIFYASISADKINKIHPQLMVWSFQRLGVICFRCFEKKIILIWMNVRRKQRSLLRNLWF